MYISGMKSSCGKGAPRCSVWPRLLIAPNFLGWRTARYRVLTTRYDTSVTTLPLRTQHSSKLCLARKRSSSNNRFFRTTKVFISTSAKNLK